MVFPRIATAQMPRGAGSPCYSLEALDPHGWTLPQYEVEMKRDFAHADLTANDCSSQLCAGALYDEARKRLIARTQYYDNQVDLYLVDQAPKSPSHDGTNEDCFDLEYERVLLMEEEIRIRQKHEEVAKNNRDCMVREGILVRLEIAHKKKEEELNTREETLKRCEREKEEREKAFRQAVIKKYQGQYNNRISKHEQEKVVFANVQAQFFKNAKQHEISANYLRNCEESIKEQQRRIDIQLEDLVEREFRLDQESKRLETLNKSLELTSKIENIVHTQQVDSTEIDELKNELLLTQGVITELELDVVKIENAVFAIYESSDYILTEERVEKAISWLEEKTFGGMKCDFCCREQKRAKDQKDSKGCSVASKNTSVKNKAVNTGMLKPVAVKHTAVNTDIPKPVALKHMAVNTDTPKPVALKHTAVNTDIPKPLAIKHTAVNTDIPKPLAIKHTAVNTDIPKPLAVKHMAVNTDIPKTLALRHTAVNTEHSLPLFLEMNHVNTEKKVTPAEEESTAHLKKDNKKESMWTWIQKQSRDLFGGYFDVISMLIYKHIGDQTFDLDATTIDLSSLGYDAIIALDTYAKSVQLNFERQAIELSDVCHGFMVSDAMANYLMSICDKTHLFLMTKSPKDLLELAKRVESSTEFQHWVFVEEYLRFFRLCMDQDTGEILSWSQNQDMINRARRHCMTDTGVYPTSMTIMRTIHQWQEEELLRFDKLYAEEVKFITRYAVREHLL